MKLFIISSYLLVTSEGSSLFLLRFEPSLDPLVQVLEVLITSELNMVQAAPGVCVCVCVDTHFPECFISSLHKNLRKYISHELIDLNSEGPDSKL